MVEGNDYEEAVEKKSVSASEPHAENRSMNLVGITEGHSSSDAASTARIAAGAIGGAAMSGLIGGRILPELNIQGMNSSTLDGKITPRELREAPVGGGGAGSAGRGDGKVTGGASSIPETGGREGRGESGERPVNEIRQLGSRDDLVKELKAAGTAVREGISELPKDLQAKFGTMKNNEDGTYSKEQLAFIKANCGKDTYGAAQAHDTAMRDLHTIDSLLRPADQREPRQGANDRLAGMSREELATNAKKDAALVREGISKLDPLAQKEYGRLQGNKDGSLSNEQLAFIKKNCDKDTYAAAQDFNRTLEAMSVLKEQGGLRDRSGMKQDAANAHAQVDKAISQLDPVQQKLFGQIAGKKDGSYSDKQLEFIKANCPKDAYAAAQQYNRLNERLNSGAPVAEAARQQSDRMNHHQDDRVPHRQDDRVPHGHDDGVHHHPAEAIERLTDTTGRFAVKEEAAKAHAQVDKAISQLDPVQQKLFGQIDGNKDGSYSAKQLEFIKANCPKEAYMAAQKYNRLNERLNSNSVADEAGRQAGRMQDGRGNDASDRMQNRQEKPERLQQFYKNELEKAEKGVNKALAGMSPESQKAFDKLHCNKDGTYSQEQLAFLKHNSKEGYSAASTYNAAWRSLIDLRLNSGNHPENRESIKPNLLPSTPVPAESARPRPDASPVPASAEIIRTLQAQRINKFKK